MMNYIKVKKKLCLESVKRLYEHYQETIKSRPNYGRLGNGGVTITLPQELCWDWANKCAGDSGGERPRPVGIRLEPGVIRKDFVDQDLAIQRIWESPESLYDVIQRYGGGGAEHLAQKILQKQKNKKQKKEKEKEMLTSVDIRDYDCRDAVEDTLVRELTLKILELAVIEKDYDMVRDILNGKLDEYRIWPKPIIRQ